MTILTSIFIRQGPTVGGSDWIEAAIFLKLFERRFRSLDFDEVERPTLMLVLCYFVAFFEHFYFPANSSKTFETIRIVPTPKVQQPTELHFRR